MNKKAFIFIVVVVGFLLFFAVGLFYSGQNEAVDAVLSVDVDLSEEKPVPISVTPTATPATILIFGDMMLDRKVREQINKNGPEYPFALIKDFLQGNDIVVANAEGPFTSNNSVTLGKKDAPLTFTFDPAILPTIKSLGFNLLGQANNHSLNFGMAGFRQSTSFIEAAGLNWFGDPRNVEVKAHVAEVRGEKIAFIGYHEFAYQGLENVLQAIKDAKKVASFIVVYPHWGEEYKLDFNAAQQKTAHAFIDAGADVVVGAHPHVIQPIEVYNGKTIFYSLGNFIFDQAANAPTGRGLAIKISLTSDFARYDIFPISIIKQQAALMTEEDRQVELDRLDVPVGTIFAPRERVFVSDSSAFKTVQIGAALINAELVDTESERMQGLSGRKSLASDAGMLFAFDRPSNWGIWMKDMNFPIDVLWITDDLNVGDIVENMSPASYPHVYAPKVSARYVLEVPAGTVKKYGLTIGQDVFVK